MKFIVKRASAFSNEDICCDEAKRDSIVRVETRTCRTPEEFDEKFALWNGAWLSNGTNHRVNENGYITRDMGTIDVWTVEINTLEELVAFCDKYDDLVIGRCMWNRDYREILIYDDYIE